MSRSSLNESQMKKFTEWLSKQDGRPSNDSVRIWIGDNLRVSFNMYSVAALMKEASRNIVGARHEEDGPKSLKLPGYGLPLNYSGEKEETFPSLLCSDESEWTAVTLLIREVCMLKFVEEITNKPEWWIKVRKPEIAEKWKKEAVEMDWTSYRQYADFTPAMADACIAELLKKADIYEQTGLVPVMDYSACVLKSDNLIPEDMKESLKSAVAILENVPEDQKDWHPGSNKRVLDLVHPSLWPLVYARSRILPDKRITVQDCLAHCGMGETIPEPLPFEARGGADGMSTHHRHATSARFQWLPCDVNLTAGGAKIDSYINNLHPVKHAALYPVIEKFIEKALPAWDMVRRWPEDFQLQRLTVKEVGKDCKTPKICQESDYGCSQTSRPLNEGEQARGDDEEYADWYEGSERQRLDVQWHLQTHPVILPEPRTDADYFNVSVSDFKASGFFNGQSRIQVIVKLANIHLTPENPTYEGGSWHIEGQLNEHICATALFYYDSDNITDCRLDFRTAANEEDLSLELGYEQDDHDSIQRTFAIRPRDTTLQDIGSVLTREDRALFFPNIYQHHVSPFSLADRTRPGHRKILALFLVDPAISIISTANIPPQQRHWWAERALPSHMPSKLPPEVMNMVVKSLDFPIDEKEAKEIRLQLMKERTMQVEETNRALDRNEWNFCEH